jgi:ATP-dependent Clp protease protease subunit
MSNAAEDETKKPVPIAAQEETELFVETPVPMAAQETSSATKSNDLKEAGSEKNGSDLAQTVKRLQLEQNKLMLEHEQTLLKLQLEKDRLLLENELHDVKQTKLLSELKALQTRLELENSLHEQQQRKLLATLQAEREKLEVQNALTSEKNRQEEMRIQLAMTRMEFERSQLGIEIDTLDRELTTREKREEWDNQVNKPKEYLKEPFVGGELVISDRKIMLDGIIWSGTASYIVERIQYYNNKSSEYPIFLVIDYCPGGSVMEGSRIVKAMQKSKAPIYVVVKSFAASMAAVITTLAERSYALPDAIVIHHQLWSFSWGNRTEQREQLKIMDEWSERILGPVADKMGITVSEFVMRMYQHNSAGDWFEFANSAVKYKWVDYIVEDIRDLSYTKKPLDEEKEDDWFWLLVQQEKIDDQGKRYVKLPRLRAMDAYYLYNPENYYRY